ncbi:MAG: Fe-S-containing hydro-lyase [Nitrospinota bacterium]
MSGEKRLQTPLSDQDVEGLRVGDKVLLSGTLLTARDAAHKRLVERIDEGEDLPVDLKGQVMYFVGPTPPKPGEVIGSAGPTTSSRMDKYSPKLMALGLKGMIGKGWRGPQVVEAMKNFRCVYFAAIGGAGALLSRSIKSSEVVAYGDLGTEAIRRLGVEEFPVLVANDVYGNDLFQMGKEAYARKGDERKSSA